MIALLCAAALSGCTTSRPARQVPPLPEEGNEERIRNEGYSLLYTLMDQERNVGKILIIKRIDEPSANLIKAISERCGQAKDKLDELQERYPGIDMEMTHLPVIEQKARDSIASAATKQLLFSAGELFRARLLLTQAEAMKYGAHLAKALHDQEINEERKPFLDELSKDLTDFHDQVVELVMRSE